MEVQKRIQEMKENEEKDSLAEVISQTELAEQKLQVNTQELNAANRIRRQSLLVQEQAVSAYKIIEQQFDEVQHKMGEQAAVLELERFKRLDDMKEYEQSKLVLLSVIQNF